MKRSKSNYCIFYRKYYNGRLELVMFVHIDDVFMSGRPETLEKIKEIIKLKFNIQESEKEKKFLGVYYKWGHDTKDSYSKMNMEKDVKKLVEVYKKFIGIYVGV